MNKSYYTGCISASSLFGRPSLKSGAARVLDLAGTFDVYNTSESGEQADIAALEHDWQCVGASLRGAIVDFVALHLGQVSSCAFAPHATIRNGNSDEEKAFASKR